jgi:sarcosine oxidase subunit beta
MAQTADVIIIGGGIHGSSLAFHLAERGVKVSADDVKRLAPSFSTEGINLAAYEPESGYADPYSATASFLDAARRMGATLVQDCEVTVIEVNGSKIKGVKSTQGDYAAPVVVNCAGPWAARIGKMVDLDLPVDTWQHDTMMVKRPKEIGPSHPSAIDDIMEMYFRPETGGLTLVGLEDSNPVGESPDGQTDHAKPGFVERAIEHICQRIPVMEKAALQSAHGGYDGISPDQRAILGPAGPDGFYLQCAFSGTGFKIGPAVGKCMSELILDGEAKTVDITPFRLKRFEEGRHLEGEHKYENIWR